MIKTSIPVSRHSFCIWVRRACHRPNSHLAANGGSAQRLATLRALLWRPQGKDPFHNPSNHGSGRSRQELQRLGAYEQQAYALGPVFARHGYVFFYPFRRGVGLSADQGTNAVDP
jgi:hypothetical protein